MQDIFLSCGLTLIPEWLSNHIRIKVCDDVIHPFQNFNGCTVEVWEWISNFIPLSIMDVITYPCLNFSYTMLVKGVPALYCLIYGWQIWWISSCAQPNNKLSSWISMVLYSETVRIRYELWHCTYIVGLHMHVWPYEWFMKCHYSMFQFCIYICIWCFALPSELNEVWMRKYSKLCFIGWLKS